MSWTNYHSHTNYCDGGALPELYIKNAINLGMRAYGYSSHAPVNFETDWCIPEDKFEAYLTEIEHIKNRYSSEIDIYLGLEIDFISENSGYHKHLIKAVHERLDYFIGSIHFIDSFDDGEYWNIDNSRELFDRGFKELFNSDFKKLSERFYEVSRQMIREDAPDIIGHMDKLKMHNSNNCYFSEDEMWYRKHIEETLNCIKSAGTIVEVNTRGYYRYNQLDLYPSQWIIEKMAQKNIPIMLNSDAHQPDELIAGFAYAADILKKSGVKHLWAMVDSKWEAFEYTTEGLQLGSR